MSHLTRDELRRWHETGAAGDRERILTHLADCSECRGAYADLARVDAQPAAEDYGAFVARGIAAYDDRNQPARRQRKVLWLGVPAAAAAILLVAVNLRQPEAPLSEPSAEVRGAATIAAEAPAGDIGRVTEFRWTAHAGATRYRVTVRSADGREVFTRESTESSLTRVDLPMPAGRYAWVVEAFDAAGQRLSVSRPQAFQIR